MRYITLFFPNKRKSNEENTISFAISFSPELERDSSMILQSWLEKHLGSEYLSENHNCADNDLEIIDESHLSNPPKKHLNFALYENVKRTKFEEFYNHLNHAAVTS